MGSKGTLTTLGVREGASHIGQLNTGMGLDWTGIRVIASNNPLSKLFALVKYFTNNLVLK
jgi:hypothetical protein